MQTNIDRAKQFLPFAALKGYNEALRQKEKELEYINKYELSIDKIDEITNKLNNLDKNKLIKIKYYHNHNYITIEGYIKKIDDIYKYLVINNNNIYFKDILEIKE